VAYLLFKWVRVIADSKVYGFSSVSVVPAAVRALDLIANPRGSFFLGVSIRFVFLIFGHDIRFSTDSFLWRYRSVGVVLRHGFLMNQLPLVHLPQDLYDPPLGIEVYKIRSSAEFCSYHIAKHLHLLAISRLGRGLGFVQGIRFWT